MSVIDQIQVYNTGLTKEQISEAFSKSLEDYTKAEIDGLLAQKAAASALDSMHLEECTGTIAGDDTIFAACPGIEEAKALAITISDMMEKG